MKRTGKLNNGTFLAGVMLILSYIESSADNSGWAIAWLVFAGLVYWQTYRDLKEEAKARHEFEMEVAKKGAI